MIKLVARSVLTLAIGSAFGASPAAASENGTSFYLLGSGGPGAALLPPLEGVFFDDTLFYYSGKAGANKDFVVGGNVVAGLDAEVLANFATALWVPTTNLAGGTLALGGTLPIGRPDIEVDAVLTGPNGLPIALSARDSATVVGDPVISATLGWKVAPNTHLALGTMVNVPVGNYRNGELANLAFHRWAVDVSGAVTWRSADKGWDLSSKIGVTFNGENDATDYDTGSEFHIEASVERLFSPAFSAGLLAYHFNQISGDSGSGATLGSFKGRVSAVGATAAYNFMINGKIPATTRIRFLEEFGVDRRMDGRSIFLSFSMPLSVKMPPASPPAP